MSVAKKKSVLFPSPLPDTMCQVCTVTKKQDDFIFTQFTIEFV